MKQETDIASYSNVAFRPLTGSTVSAEGTVCAEAIFGAHAHSLYRCTTYLGLSYFVNE